MNEFLFLLLLSEGTQAIYELNKNPQEVKTNPQLKINTKKK